MCSSNYIRNVSSLTNVELSSDVGTYILSYSLNLTERLVLDKTGEKEFAAKGRSSIFENMLKVAPGVQILLHGCINIAHASYYFWISTNNEWVGTRELWLLMPLNLDDLFDLSNDLLALFEVMIAAVVLEPVRSIRDSSAGEDRG